MSLIVISFTFLEGLDNEIVVKELAVADSHINSLGISFKRPYGGEEVPMFNARMNQAIGRGCNWNDGDVPYSELENVLHREVSFAVAIYCFEPQKTNFIIGRIDRTVIDITQLGCTELAGIILPAISCTLHVTTSPYMVVHCEQPIP